MPEPGLSELATTTLYNRTKTIHDNVLNNNAILYKMDKVGNVQKNEGGRELVEEVDYQENQSFIRYRGNQILNTSQTPVLTSFRYPWAQAAVAVIMNGLEEVQNSGMEASIKLLTARIKNAERTIRNQINGDVMSDGTADGGLQIGGLDLLLAEDPTTGTVGGIARATNAFAQNFSFDTTADGTGDASVSNIERYMRTCMTNTYRMGDTNRLWVLGNTYWQFLLEAASSRQRFVDEDLIKLGIENIKFDGVTVILGGGYRFAGTTAVAMDATKGWLINLDYLKLRVGRGRFFQPLSKRDSINQDAMIQYLVFCGQLTCSNFGLHAVVFDQ